MELQGHAGFLKSGSYLFFIARWIVFLRAMQ
jgi:hypothetical protein